MRTPSSLQTIDPRLSAAPITPARAAGAVLLFSLLAYATPSFAGLNLSLSYFAVPLAAWLVHRHGRRGLLVVAVGIGLTWVRVAWLLPPIAFGTDAASFLQRRPFWLLLPLTFSSPVGVFQTEIGVGAAALAAAAFAGSGWPGRRPWRARALPAVMLVAILVLLPFSLPLYGEELGGGWRVYARLRLLPACDAALFFLGFSAVRARPVLALIAAATALGVWLRVHGVLEPLAALLLPGLERSALRVAGPLRYDLDSAIAGLGAAAFFLAGRSLRERADGDGGASSSRRAWLVPIGLMLVWAGDRLLGLLPGDHALAALLGSHRRFGDLHALLAAALWAGVERRGRGVAAVVATWAAVTGAAVVLRAADIAPDAGFALEELPLVVAFGGLGTALRWRASGSAGPQWRLDRWALYVAMLAATVPLLFDLEEPGGWIATAATISMLIVVALVGVALLRRAGGAHDAASGRGWLGLSGVLLFGAAVLSHLEELAPLLDSLPALAGAAAGLVAGRAPDPASAEGIEAVVVFLAGIGTFAATVAALLDGLPALRADARRLQAFVRDFPHEAAPGDSTPAPTPTSDAPAEAPDRIDRLAARGAAWARWMRNGAFAAAGAAALLALAILQAA